MHYKQSNPAATTKPDGEYEFMVTGAEEKTANSGNAMIALTHRIKDGPVVYDYLVDTEGAYFKWDQFRAAIGETVQPGVEIEIKPHTWIGKVGRCILYTDEYQGKRSNKVSEYILPPSKPPGAPPVTKSAWK